MGPRQEGSGSALQINDANEVTLLSGINACETEEAG